MNSPSNASDVKVKIELDPRSTKAGVKRERDEDGKSDSESETEKRPKIPDNTQLVEREDQKEFVVYRYTTGHSAENEALNDWRIGERHQLIGSNQPNNGRISFVVVEMSPDNREGNLLGYCGQVGERVLDQQPWADANGHTWKFIYRYPTNQRTSARIGLLGPVEEVCQAIDVDSSIFYGYRSIYPRRSDRPALTRVHQWAEAGNSLPVRRSVLDWIEQQLVRDIDRYSEAGNAISEEHKEEKNDEHSDESVQNSHEPLIPESEAESVGNMAIKREAN